MGGVRGRAYAIGGALISMRRMFKTRLRRWGVKQSGEIDIEFKIVDEYTVKVNKIKVFVSCGCCNGIIVIWFIQMVKEVRAAAKIAMAEGYEEANALGKSQEGDALSS
ncbi:hypothetical protein Tco_0741533, partial [Tanacetum coccineum]